MLGELIILLAIQFIILSILILGMIWNSLDEFFHTHYTFFRIMFVIIYFLEQVVFIGLSYLFIDKSSFYPLIVGFFALTVLTTVGLQSIMMESINRKSNEKLNEYIAQYHKERYKIKIGYEKQISNLMDNISSLEHEKFL